MVRHFSSLPPSRLRADERARELTQPLIRALERMSPMVDLVIRLWLAAVFFKFGLTKLSSWDITVALFSYQYDVPLLAPAVAARMAMTIELIFPALLALGWGARLSSAVLFVFNAVTVAAYPDLSQGELKDHIYWGLLLLVPMFHGPGRVSLDYLIRSKSGMATATSR